MSSENINENNNYKKVISHTELDKFFNNRLKNFPRLNKTLNTKYWKLYDKNDSRDDGDQLKTVTGICLMISVLVCTGAVSIFL